MKSIKLLYLILALVFLAVGCKKKPTSTRTPLHQAARTGNIEQVKKLLTKRVNINAQSNILHETPLHEAAEEGQKGIVELLIDNGAEINAKDRRGRRPLHNAAGGGHAEIVEFLIANGAEINAKDRRGRRSLHNAAGGGHAEIVEFLIANGAEVDATSQIGCTPLHRAAGEGHKDVVELLLNKGADINREYGNGDTALSEATLNGHRDVVELLLAKGADITAGCMSRYVSLQDSMDKDFKGLAEYLVAKYGPYSIIVANPQSVQKLLAYWQIDFDGIWTPEQADLEGLDDILRSYLQNTTVIKAKPHFSRKFILTYFDQYSREYSGITRDGARYVICQMILPNRFPEMPPDNAFSMIHGFANGVVRVVFELKIKTVVEIDCEYWM